MERRTFKDTLAKLMSFDFAVSVLHCTYCALEKSNIGQVFGEIIIMA